MAGEVPVSRFRAGILIHGTLAVSSVPLILLLLFLFLSPFTLIDLGLGKPQALAFDALLSLFFFAQHSIMVRRGVRKGLSGLVPEDYYSAFYALTSGAALLIVMMLWQRIPGPLFSAEGVPYWILRALFLLCFAGFHWGARSLGSFDPFGVKRIRRLISNRETRTMPLTIRGAYRWVRHPLYFFSIIMIWSCPEVTPDRLLFNVLWTTWILLATLLEERDLVADFGDRYREYQATVPMIVPWRFPGRSGRDITAQ